jgi:hypothetical protein
MSLNCYAVRRLALCLCAVALLALVGCGGGQGGGQSASTTAAPPYEFPFTLKNTISAVAAGGKGVYVVDFGSGNSLSLLGQEYQPSVTAESDDGRILLLEAGGGQKVVATKVGAPMDIAVGPDNSVYFIDALRQRRVMRIADGTSTPAALPFDIKKARPWRIAVSAAGDVVLLTEENIQTLPKGAQTVTTVPNHTLHPKLFAVGPDGATYYDFAGDIAVMKKGEKQAYIFMKLPGPSTLRVMAIAVDSNGDFYRLDECGPSYPKDDGSCKDSSFALHKFIGKSGAWTPSAVPIERLTSPTSMAIDATGIYIADGQRVMKVAKP